MSAHTESTINRRFIKGITVVGSVKVEENSSVTEETICLSSKDFPSICRLCLRRDRLVKLKDHLHLTDVIRNITNIQVARFDGYPQQICEVCILQLENILEFIDTTRNCNESLQKIKETTDEKRHMCTLCPKSFSRIGALKRHLECHNLVQKYRCNICSRGFGRRSILTHHLTTHTPDKPFYCTVCSRGFALKEELEKHKSKHGAHKPFHCEVCPKKFGNMQELRQHTRYHTGQKPYSCQLCNKRFCQLGHLNLHVSTQHKTDGAVSEDAVMEDIETEDIFIEHIKDEEETVDETELLMANTTKQLIELENEVSPDEPGSSDRGRNVDLPVCAICSNRFEVCFSEDK
ncbi:unnamed protein product [Phaedon cochleariae]|uniref:Zinc finger protein n=1 Tax=Phaedon cochleariae TaxID=80249 RepID=A0A9N9SBU0_PHACE|nr:unnamed protein product [Phaedon cochleariae]